MSVHQLQDRGRVVLKRGITRRILDGDTSRANFLIEHLGLAGMKPSPNLVFEPHKPPMPIGTERVRHPYE